MGNLFGVWGHQEIDHLFTEIGPLEMRWRFPVVTVTTLLLVGGAVAVALLSHAATATVVVAPNGDDSAAGTSAAPLKALNKAVSVVQPGQTVLVHGVAYKPTSIIRITKSGTASARITLRPYGTEKVVSDLSRMPAGNWGIDQRANYWVVPDQEIKNGPCHAYLCTSCRADLFQRLDGLAVKSGSGGGT